MNSVSIPSRPSARASSASRVISDAGTAFTTPDPTRRARTAWKRSRASFTAGLRELRAHQRVPAAVAQELALGDQHARGRSHEVARTRTPRRDRLLDHLRHGFRRPAEARERAALINTRRGLGHASVEVGIRTI